MRAIKLYDEATVYEGNIERSFFADVKDLFKSLPSVLALRRNNIIDKRIAAIRAGINVRPWNEMNETERIQHIYHKMAVQKAIERMSLLKN